MDDGTFDLKKLRTFQIVAKNGTLRSAASRLRLTVPAISFQLKRLEVEVGVPLFHRLPTGLILTPMGHAFLREAEAILKRVEEAATIFARKPDIGGTLSLATSSDIVWFMTGRIATFVKQNPTVSFQHHVYTSNFALSLVKSGGLDAAIGYFPRVPKTLATELIVESTLSLVAPDGHPILRKGTVRVEDLARYKLIMLPHQSATRGIIDRKMGAAGLKGLDTIEAGNCQTAREFAALGVGIAIAHSLCINQASAGHLRYLDLGHIFGRINFSVVYRRAAPQSAGLRALIKHLTTSV